MLIVPALDAGIFLGNAAMAVSGTAMMKKRSSKYYKNLIGRAWRSPPSSVPEQ
jgi:hypothetical protein